MLLPNNKMWKKVKPIHTPAPPTCRQSSWNMLVNRCTPRHLADEYNNTIITSEHWSSNPHDYHIVVMHLLR